MNESYDDRMREARQRVARALVPQTEQEHAIVQWLGKWDLPTLETLALLVERRITTTERGARMEMANRTLRRWEPHEHAPATEVQAMQFLADGGDPADLPRPLREWGQSSVHQVNDTDLDRLRRDQEIGDERRKGDAS